MNNAAAKEAAFEARPRRASDEQRSKLLAVEVRLLP
jgi:hypothetical protein